MKAPNIGWIPINSVIQEQIINNTSEPARRYLFHRYDFEELSTKLTIQLRKGWRIKNKIIKNMNRKRILNKDCWNDWSLINVKIIANDIQIIISSIAAKKIIY